MGWLTDMPCEAEDTEAMFWLRESENGDRLLGTILEKKTVWPCISYLAAWNDAYGRNTGEKERPENGCDI